MSPIFSVNSVAKPPTVLVKVCGTTCTEDISVCHALGVDAVGFLVGERKRNPDGSLANDKIALEECRRLIAAVPKNMCGVLLVHSTEIEFVRRQVSLVRPNAIQIQRQISLTDLEVLRRHLPGAVSFIKTVYVAPGSTLEDLLPRCQTLASSDLIDAILLDSKVGRGTGGKGRTHDWEMSRTIVQKMNDLPIILAGGLNPENVRLAIETVAPYAVDVMSGVRQNGRVDKDYDKIARFVQAAKKS